MSRAPLALTELAKLAGAVLPQPLPVPAPQVEHAASLQQADSSDVAFCASTGHREALRATRAAVVLVPAEMAGDCPTVALVCADPYRSMARILQQMYAPAAVEAWRHPSALVDDSVLLDEPVHVGAGCVVDAHAVIGAGTFLGTQCLIGAGVRIGADCRLHPRVTLLPGTRLGARVEIWSGTVLGSDGFGYAQEKGAWVKLHHRGGVEVGDDCEIGANTTIDRGMLEDTVIGRGVKIDNQVQVAHNVRIGDHSALAGCVGIAGSAVLGRHCQIGGGAGVQGHVELADGVIITGMSKANQSLPEPGSYSSGTAIQGTSTWLRNCARFRNLDRIVRSLKSRETE